MPKDLKSYTPPFDPANGLVRVQALVSKASRWEWGGDLA